MLPADTEPYADDGTGPDGRIGVVLSHGFTGTPASMRPWAEHLAAAGFAVRLPLLPGHGGTWQEANRSAWPQWYGAIESAYAELRERCDAVFAMGLSMGGTLDNDAETIFSGSVDFVRSVVAARS